MQDGGVLHHNERRAGDRRRQRRYIFREQRTGFDRRGPGQGGSGGGILHNALIGLRDRPGTLLVLLATVNALNLADFAFTLNVLASGGGEANPIMRSLFAMGPVWAGVFKVVLVFLASQLTWHFRRYRKTLGAAVAMLVVFVGVFVYHLCFPLLS
jgi:hypothetical protein